MHRVPCRTDSRAIVTLLILPVTPPFLPPGLRRGEGRTTSDCSRVKASAPPATLSFCAVLMVAIQPTSGSDPRSWGPSQVWVPAVSVPAWCLARDGSSEEGVGRAGGDGSLLCPVRGPCVGRAVVCAAASVARPRRVVNRPGAYRATHGRPYGSDGGPGGRGPAGAAPTAVAEVRAGVAVGGLGSCPGLRLGLGPCGFAAVSAASRARASPPRSLSGWVSAWTGCASASFRN